MSGKFLSEEPRLTAPAHRPVPDDLLPWACAALGLEPEGLSLAPVAGDASNRRYFRLRAGPRSAKERSAVVMEAPPATEKNREFLAVREALAAGGVRVPALYAADLARGYLLLEDLGDQLLLPLLDADSAPGWYARASEVLLRLARVDARAARVPAYDSALLGEELDRLPEWFLQALLGLDLSTEELDLLARLKAVLIDSALAQPAVLVHRDFHGRNLMPQAGGELGVIDFQDAVLGPITYDAVSLLKDCYIRWPQAEAQQWALDHRDRLVAAGLLEDTPDEFFTAWFDLMGLQRHLKVLGTFARLYLRDAKPGYLDDLPRVLAYVEEVVATRGDEHPALAEFGAWWQGRVRPVIAQQNWYRPA